MLELKDMGFEVDFPALKLKTACGEQVCRVLLFACDHVRCLGAAPSPLPAVRREIRTRSRQACLNPIAVRACVRACTCSFPWCRCPSVLQALQFQNFHFGRPTYHEEE
jgi:hypothetical protein